MLGGLFVGQFVSGRPFSGTVALAGGAGWIALVTLSTFLAEGGEEP